MEKLYSEEVLDLAQDYSNLGGKSNILLEYTYSLL